ncbi:hypothetical protein Ancab_026998 [Ancistrocladus abbreviatus]
MQAAGPGLLHTRPPLLYSIDCPSTVFCVAVRFRHSVAKMNNLRFTGIHELSHCLDYTFRAITHHVLNATFASVARQSALQLSLETTVISGFYAVSLTPTSNMGASSLDAESLKSPLSWHRPASSSQKMSLHATTSNVHKRLDKAPTALSRNQHDTENAIRGPDNKENEDSKICTA